MLGIWTYIAITLLLFVRTIKVPAVGVAAILCLYGLKQWGQSSTAFFSQYRQITNIDMAAIGLLGLMVAVSRRSCLLCSVGRVSMWVWLLYGYALLSTVWSPNVSTSLEQWSIQGPYIFIVALLAPLLIDDTEAARQAILFTAVTASLICALALAFGNWGSRGLTIYGDYSDAETNPLAISDMAGTAAICAVFLFLMQKSVAIRMFCLVTIPLCTAVILRSGSRGQLLTLAPAIFAGWLVIPRDRQAKSAASALVFFGIALALIWFVLPLVQIDKTRWDNSLVHDDVTGRIQSAVTLLSVSFSGFGTGIFGLGNSSSYEVLGIYPHVTVLEVLAEEGLPGIFLYLGVIIGTIGNVLRAMRRYAGDRQAQSVVGALMALFVFAIALSWKQGTLLSSVYVFAYAIVIERLAAPAHSRASEDDIQATSAAVDEERFLNIMR